jgi:hypothetical protein
MSPMPPYVVEVCRVRRGANKCRYLLHNGQGWYECGKLNAGLKTVLDRRVRDGSLPAIGDHCPGQTSEILNQPNVKFPLPS